MIVTVWALMTSFVRYSLVDRRSRVQWVFLTFETMKCSVHYNLLPYLLTSLLVFLPLFCVGSKKHEETDKGVTVVIKSGQTKLWSEKIIHVNRGSDLTPVKVVFQVKRGCGSSHRLYLLTELFVSLLSTYLLYKHLKTFRKKYIMKKYIRL